MKTISELKPGAHIHLMGICGTAMASLAGLFKDFGFKVTGSDENVYPPMSTQLEDLGIEIMEGYEAKNLNPKPDFVIVGNVISKHFEEAQALLELKIPYTSLPSAMGEFVIGNGESVVVAGTHGKTTTTSMLAWLGEKCGKAPGFLIGGIPENFPRSFRAPQKVEPWFVIEGDEYDTAYFDKVPKFIHYRPKFVVLTSIEFDHADIYESLDSIFDAFRLLLERISDEGILLYNGDDANVVKLVSEFSNKKYKKVSFGINSGDYRAVHRQTIVGRNQYSVEFKGRCLADVAIKMFGKHNTLNSLGAFALAKEMNWDLRGILQGLAEFKGIKRRQQIIGEPRGIKIIEDFAHHPTAVDLTIESMREQFPNKKVIAIFEPRSATARSSVFQKDFTKALSKADAVILPPAFVKSNSKGESFDSPTVIEEIKDQYGKEAYFCVDVEEIVEKVVEVTGEGDIVLIMSNGGFGGIYQKLLNRIENK